MSSQSLINALCFALRELDHPAYALAASIIAADLSTYETRRLETQSLMAAAMGALVGCLGDPFFNQLHGR